MARTKGTEESNEVIVSCAEQQFPLISPLWISLQHCIGEGRVLGVSIEGNNSGVILGQFGESSAIGLPGCHLVPWQFFLFKLSSYLEFHLNIAVKHIAIQA